MNTPMFAASRNLAILKEAEGGQRFAVNAV
jgi:hypothetical protein